MSDDEPKVNYSGTFTSGSMQFAARDMTINAPTEGQIGSVNQQLADVDLIEKILAQLRLTDEERQTTGQAIDQLREELAKPEPNQPRAASALQDLTTVLTAAGGLVGAGLGLISPIGRIAEALGGAAVGILKTIRRP
jgi:hypothetical protein